MTTTTYGPEFLRRGPDGKILLIDDSSLRDEPPPAAPPPAPPAAEAPAPAAPRRHGDAPTPFGQLRPGPVGGGGQAPARDDWRLWLGSGLAVAIIGLAIWAIVQTYQAPTQPAAAPSAAVIGTPAPAASAVPTATIARAIVVFDAVGGAPIGALEPGRPYVLLVERGDWRQLEVAGSGIVWARAWEMDGAMPPQPTPLPTLAPAPPAPVVRPAQQSAPAVVPVGPAVTCLPVTDADNGGAYLGEACGATSAERQATALALLQAAPPPTIQQ